MAERTEIPSVDSGTGCSGPPGSCLWRTCLDTTLALNPTGQTLQGTLSYSQGGILGFVLLLCRAWYAVGMARAAQQLTTNTDSQPLREEVENEEQCHGQGQAFCTPFIILVLEWKHSSLHFADRKFLSTLSSAQAGSHLCARIRPRNVMLSLGSISWSTLLLKCRQLISNCHYKG